jgi:hypothetical protein
MPFSGNSGGNHDTLAAFPLITETATLLGLLGTTEIHENHLFKKILSIDLADLVDTNYCKNCAVCSI